MEAEFIKCPECNGVASIADRSLLDSTDGPVPHVKIFCGIEKSHWFYMPEDMLR